MDNLRYYDISKKFCDMHNTHNQGITDKKYFGYKRYLGALEPGCGRPKNRACFENPISKPNNKK